MGLPSIPGYVEVGGWLFEEKHLDVTLRVLTPTPRRYNVLDQVRTDFRSSAGIYWLVSIGAIIYSTIAIQWIGLVLGGLLLLVLANAARIMVGVVRHGVVGQVTIDHIDKRNDIAAETFDVPAGDSRMTVVFGPPTALESMLELGPVDILVLYDPRKVELRGHSFAVRSHKVGEADLSELQQLLGTLTGRPWTF